MATSYLITGGAGFIGSNLIHYLRETRPDAHLTIFDALTYAGNLDSLAGALDSDHCTFVHADLCDREAVRGAIATHRPQLIFNLAAESHVDRSIDSPGAFVRTNVTGTFELLEAARGHFTGLPPSEQQAFRVLHVSTDEVYGSLGAEGLFTEQSPYAPNSPYAATKAAADHLAHAYWATYQLPTLTTNCSNNFGPYQFPEKLLPLVLLNALEHRPLPVYGDGQNVRDWLFVRDHCEALLTVAERGEPGETYNIGASQEHTTLQMVHAICDALAAERPPEGISSYRELVEMVPDRPGHDRRYGIDAGKIRKQLGWEPRTSFADGMRATVRWYLDHQGWCQRIHDGAYRRQRLGLGGGATGEPA